MPRGLIPSIDLVHRGAFGRDSGRSRHLGRSAPQLLICAKDVKGLTCDDDLKRIIAKAICPRKSRYPDAREMLRALQGDGDQIQTALESLTGKTVVFTGPLSIRRFDAAVMIRQCGGAVADQVSTRVDVVVQGRRSPHYRHGHKGDKLCEAEKLIRQGHSLGIINEKQFGSWAKNGKSPRDGEPNQPNTKELWRQRTRHLPILAHEPTVQGARWSLRGWPRLFNRLTAPGRACRFS